jgi:hypothetical protein
VAGTTHAIIIYIFIAIYQEGIYSPQRMKVSMDQCGKYRYEYLVLIIHDWALGTVEGFSPV